MIGAQRGLRPELCYEVSKPPTRVELHVHLDGSFRHETIYELSKLKNLPLPGDGSFLALQNYLVVKKGVSLADFLSRFDVILKPFYGDLKALERAAYEFVEDSSKEGLAYVEARYCPHIIIPEHFHDEQSEESKKWTWDVTGALIKGLKRGHTDFRTKCNLIITCIRGKPDYWFEDSMELVKDSNFHEGWVVGIDIAGLADSASEEVMLTASTEKFCTEALQLGIPRTCHAGESGYAEQVTNAVDKLHAMRIGHGYRIVSDPKVYERIRKDQIHLECCPWSSILTGSICRTVHPHPIVQFFQDDFNVSLNRDDPTVTGSSMDCEFSLVRSWGLSEAHLVKASFDAARASFLPENEKADLLQNISKTFGFYSRNAVHTRN